MNKFVVAALAVTATLLAGVSHGARTTQEISPHGLGDRSVLSTRAISERLAPVGTVCVEGEACGDEIADAGGASAAGGAAAPSGPRDGQTVYNTACTACHSTGAAGAPVTGDSAAWAPRLAKGVDVLFQHTWDGFGAMPPRGMCMDCSEEEVRAAVDYLIEQAQ
ncbi:c-type cytochrome [Alcanivorax quisquiliarum]|uniref:C-type cytochrome n=1 Tax=Alcanivorax quisquiliarum TaxID=2933565 RepID=A0ABT0E951_9GAMM|nr:c-type cytochrome [Alcanivorax quisquiliarum]